MKRPAAAVGNAFNYFSIRQVRLVEEASPNMSMKLWLELLKFRVGSYVIIYRSCTSSCQSLLSMPVSILSPLLGGEGGGVEGGEGPLRFVSWLLLAVRNYIYQIYVQTLNLCLEFMFIMAALLVRFVALRCKMKYCCFMSPVWAGCGAGAGWAGWRGAERVEDILRGIAN